jgi:hypothetical protein
MQITIVSQYPRTPQTRGARFGGAFAQTEATDPPRTAIGQPQGSIFQPSGNSAGGVKFRKVSPQRRGAQLRSAAGPTGPVIWTRQFTSRWVIG